MDANDPGTFRGQRARLTCSECHRRKIKCDKNTPCDTCTKRGIPDLCSREDSVHNAPHSRPVPESMVANQAVQTLLQRVSQLEAKLHHPTQTPKASQARLVGSAASLDNERADDTADNADADAIDCDAATVLEFLAWGRKKDFDFANAPEQRGPQRPDSGQGQFTSVANVLTASTRSGQLDLLETLLPSQDTMTLLVDYHNSSLLWYHGSYSSKIFSDDLDSFFADYRGDIRHDQLNLQWLALLFAILAGSLTCASEPTLKGWGFADFERPALPLRWYEAAVTCLNMADYVEVHTIESIQAIATLTISAHVIGKSNSQSVLLGSAGKVAQSLGLHRLGSEAISMTRTLTLDQLRRREAGKRVFSQLCTQDWFSIPFSESYALNPRFHSVKPLNCNDDDMKVHPESTPTQASYCNYRYDIAALIPQLLDAMANCNTLFTKYEQVLKYDDKMRKLATACMPTFLSTNAPVAETWPPFVNWARRSLTICAAHKIIMIHRKFVGLSFTNTAFSFTRRTCIAASKTILKEAFAASDEDGPVLWIDQAFSVAAGIILSLDALHRAPGEREFGEHKQRVADTIEFLKRFEHSKIASRGVRLLSSLQQDLDKSGPIDSRKRPRMSDETGPTPPRKRPRFNIHTLIRDVSHNLGVRTSTTTPITTPSTDPPATVTDNAWDIFMDLLPPQTGFDGQYLFDELFGIEL